MTAQRKETGNRGEILAARHLESRGYRILDRNYRCPSGELDVVAELDGQVVFVEVRTRRVGCMVRPEETVDWAKAQRVVRLAQHYLVARAMEERPWRVDVVAVELDRDGRLVRLEHFPDALMDVARRRL